MQILAAGAARGAGPGPLLYAGALPAKILLIDEALEKIVDQVPLNTGVPQALRWSYDRKKIFAFTRRQSGIEVVDLASRKVTNHFVLNDGNRRVQLGNSTPDPEDRLLYATITVAVKHSDRFEIEKPRFAVIDLAQRKITRTADLPMIDGRPAGEGGLRVSPDGKFLYSFADNVRIFDTTDFKLVETIELSKPLYPGMERISMNPRDDPNEPPGTVTGIFQSTDPIVHRSIFGIARFDLTRRTFEFTPVGPVATAGMGDLRVAPDGKTGYAVAFQGAVGNRRCEFWVFDMPTRKVVRKVEFDGPVNFGYTLSGNGQQIYLHGTSPYLEIYDAATLRRRKIIELNEDLTGGILVAPRSAAR